MNDIYFYINSFSLIPIVILCVVSYINRKVNGSVPFLFSMLLIMIWVIFSSAELISNTLDTKVLWRNIVQIAMAFIPITSLWFTIDFTSNKKPIYKKIIFVSIIINAIGLILIFTDPYHHIMRESVELLLINGDPTLTINSTLLGYIFVFFRFALIFFTLVILFVFQLKSFKNMRKQISTIWIGFAITLIFLLLKNYWLKNIGITIPMSLSFIILCSFVALSIFKYKFLSIPPIAKDWVINSLSEGIVVSSKEGEVLEYNLSAKKFFQKHPNYSIVNNGKEISKLHLLNEYNKIINEYKEWSNTLKQLNDKKLELEVDTVEGVRYFEINVHHLIESNGKSRGSVSVIRDITESNKKNRELLNMAELDGLTQVYTRNTFIEKVNECEANIVSMLVIDIDNFKHINDTYGHPFGDKVLLTITQYIKSNIRNNDLIGRFGGDEFMVLLIDCDNNLCNIIANRILKTIEESSLFIEGEKINYTVSIGSISNVNSINRDFKTMFSRADVALYEVKNSGRNRVVVKNL